MDPRARSLSEADESFIQAFEACTIPKAEWTHRAHVRMAWIYLSRFDFDLALTRIRDGIKKYNHAVGGNPHGYHETVTQVYARLVRHCLAHEGSRSKSFDEFAETFAFLLDRKSPPTLKHYRSETITSEEARARFVEPDLVP